MYFRLLFLITFIALSNCDCFDGRYGKTEDQLCEMDMFEAFRSSFDLSDLDPSPKVPQPSSKKSSNKFSEFDKFKSSKRHGRKFPNSNVSLCPIPQPLVQLRVQNERVNCSIKGSRRFRQLAENYGYAVTFYYQDSEITQFIYRPEANKAFIREGKPRDFQTFPDCKRYPNFSLELNRKSDPKSVRSSTQNGVYQCSIKLFYDSRQIDSKAVYYPWDDTQVMMSYRNIDKTLIGKHLKQNINELLKNPHWCKPPFHEGFVKQLQAKMDVIESNMKVSEVKHTWNEKINFELRSYKAGNETVYQAECQVNNDLKVNIVNDPQSRVVEQVCFGVNDKYVGCYSHSPDSSSDYDALDDSSLYDDYCADGDPSDCSSSHQSSSEAKTFYWNEVERDKDLYPIRIRDEKVDVTDSSGQVFKVLLKNLSNDHRRFWCVKTFIFPAFLSEHSFESNYLSKPEAHQWGDLPRKIKKSFPKGFKKTW